MLKEDNKKVVDNMMGELEALFGTNDEPKPSEPSR